MLVTDLYEKEQLHLYGGDSPSSGPLQHAVRHQSAQQLTVSPQPLLPVTESLQLGIQVQLLSQDDLMQRGFVQGGGRSDRAVTAEPAWGVGSQLIII